MLKFVPVMVTAVPINPLDGVKDETVGGKITVKLVELVPVFPTTVTVIVPVVAPAGTVAVILVVVLAVTTAVVPLNLTILLVGVVLKLEPVMVTVVPIEPEVGVKDVILGGWSVVFKSTQTLSF